MGTHFYSTTLQSSIIPVIHVLQDKVFGRLTQTAMQLGGFVRFEHVSVLGDEHSDGFHSGSDNARISVQGLLDYASACSQTSAHVWFLFVFDESVASSDLPTEVSHSSLHRLISLATAAGDPARFVRILKSVYAKVEHEDHFRHAHDQQQPQQQQHHHRHHQRFKYVLKSEGGKSLERALKVLRKKMHSFVYLSQSRDKPGELATGEQEAESHDSLRQAILDFLQPNRTFECLQRAAPRLPVFVILISKLWNNGDKVPTLNALQKGLDAIEPGNILRYKLEVTQDGESDVFHRTPSYSSIGEYGSIKRENHEVTTVPGDAESCKDPNGTEHQGGDAGSKAELAKLENQSNPAVDDISRNEQEARDTESRHQAAGRGEEAISTREFLSNCLHNNCFDLFFGLISSVIASCSFLSERSAHERVLKELLSNVNDMAFEHGGQQAVANSLVNYLTASNELINNVPHDFSKLRAMCSLIAQNYRKSAKMFEQQAATFADLTPSWQMEVPTRKNRQVVKFELILDGKEARDEITRSYSEIRDGCLKALQDEWYQMPIQERLAIVQVLHVMDGEGKQLVQGSRSSCPFPPPRRDAPGLLVSEEGSGSRTAIGKKWSENHYAKSRECVLTFTQLHSSGSKGSKAPSSEHAGGRRRAG